MKKLILSCAICTAALLAASCSKPGITVKISGLDETELTVAHMNLKDYPVPNDSDPRVKKELIKLKNGRAVITPDSLPSLYVTVIVSSATFASQPSPLIEVAISMPSSIVYLISN